MLAGRLGKCHGTLAADEEPDEVILFCFVKWHNNVGM